MIFCLLLNIIDFNFIIYIINSVPTMKKIFRFCDRTKFAKQAGEGWGGGRWAVVEKDQ